MKAFAQIILTLWRAITMPFVLGWMLLLFCVALFADVTAGIARAVDKCFTRLSERIWHWLSESNY